MSVRLRVDGLPAPKGNKTPGVTGEARYKDHRGTWVLNPRAFMREGKRTKKRRALIDGVEHLLPRDKTKGADAFEAWKKNVRDAAIIYKAVNRHEPYRDTPLQIDAWFFLPRPPSLPKRVVYPSTKPDLEKLVRAIMDELEGLIYDNDSRFIDHYTHKRYADDEHPIGVEIAIAPVY